ncbi:MAG TPA: M56 family metallopeptidase [Sphingomicrobium sp.]|nr:M56 family metallopeptidase [Sphingomicrobium sp.]
MDALLLIAAKSLLIAGGALLLIKLAHRRSAADRSLIAHLGLAAILLLPLAAIALPALTVEAPAMLAGSEPAAAAPAPLEISATGPIAAAQGAADLARFPVAQQQPTVAAPIDWLAWAYGFPAGLLLLLTLIALARLFSLKARATVLVDTKWLSALAHAQRRMGFKSGTALLTSDELPSPISWGLMRPVILLNTSAAEARRDAEAIIAHELAHVASLDWAKLLLSRVTVALFWFNPLVWVLAREAHQLREEAADDAVLQCDIEDTDYANLLVGVARHECRGLLIGAHGVAPGRHSLTRRVRRVLDSALARAPGGWRWTSAAGFFAVGMVVPIAALQLVAPAPATASANAPATPRQTVQAAAPAAVAHSPAMAAGAAAIVAAEAPAKAAPAGKEERDRDLDASIDKSIVADVDVDVDVDVDLDAKRSSGNQVRVAAARAPIAPIPPLPPRPRSATDREIEQIISARVHRVDAAYISQMRAASPRLAQLPMDKLIALKIHGVTPSFVRELTAAGYASLDADQIVNAAIHGVSPGYVRAMAQAGVPRMAFDQLVQMKVLGVSPDYVRKLRATGFMNLTTSQIMNMRVHGVDPEDLRAARDSP